MGTDAVTIQLLNGDEYTFQSDNAEDIREVCIQGVLTSTTTFQLVAYFLNGLKKRSTYFLAMSSIKQTEEERRWVSCKKGDLLKLVEDTSEMPEDTSEMLEDSIFVLNTRTSEKGMISKNRLYTLPCVEEPTSNLQKEMRKHNETEAREENTTEQVIPVFNNCTLDLVRLPVAHTLERFAMENFRPDDSPRELWRFSLEPIRHPLLKQTNVRLEVLESYVAIMKFMGDLPTMGPSVELIEHIFRAPIKIVSG